MTTAYRSLFFTCLFTCLSSSLAIPALAQPSGSDEPAEPAAMAESTAAEPTAAESTAATEPPTMTASAPLDPTAAIDTIETDPVDAEPAAPPEAEPAPVVGAWEDYPRNTAFEVNVLWPLFPGGMVDLKVVIPTLFPNQGNWRGETILGLHSDFGWRVVREADAGNVAILAAVIGWRQFFGYGLHVDVVAHLGWRHQEGNPFDGETIHSFQGRFWAWGGYQHEFTRDFYANLRAGVGVHLFRTDRFADTEKPVAFGGDLNFGFRFN